MTTSDDDGRGTRTVMVATMTSMDRSGASGTATDHNRSTTAQLLILEAYRPSARPSSKMDDHEETTTNHAFPTVPPNLVRGGVSFFFTLIFAPMGCFEMILSHEARVMMVTGLHDLHREVFVISTMKHDGYYQVKEK